MRIFHLWHCGTAAAFAEMPQMPAGTLVSCQCGQGTVGTGAAGRSASCSHSEEQLVFSLLCVPFTVPKAERSVLQHAKVRVSRPGCALPVGFPGKPRRLLQPPLPILSSLSPRPWEAAADKSPLFSAAPLAAANNGLLFPGSCREKHRYCFLFCSAHISSKLKPNIFRYLNKRGKKKKESLHSQKIIPWGSGRRQCCIREGS